MNGLEISRFIKALPKVELHVHIEGTLTPALRWKLANRNAIELPYATYEDLLDSWYRSLRARDPHRSVTLPNKVTYNHRKELNGDDGRRTSLEAYFAGCQVLVKEDDFYELVMAGYLRAQRDGATRFGVRSNWIFCFLRDRPLSEGLEAYAAARAWARLADRSGLGLFHAVGLAANEFEKLPLLFEEGFRKARQDGLHVTLHCDVDQKDAASHIHEAIFQVCNGNGAERIDHGLNALDHPELIVGIKDRGIGLTLCPHAYHRRQATEVLFPKIKRMIDEGVMLCINSDDPTYMHDVWVDGNLQKVWAYCGQSQANMIQLVKNGIDMSWADENIKRELTSELESMELFV